MWLLVMVLLGLSREALGFHLPRKTEQRLDNSVLNQGYNYQTKFFTQEVKLCREDVELHRNSIPGTCPNTGHPCLQIDHYSVQEGTFQQRYLINAEYWGGRGKPIFVYTGNEGDITWFCNNTVRQPHQ